MLPGIAHSGLGLPGNLFRAAQPGVSPRIKYHCDSKTPALVTSGYFPAPSHEEVLNGRVLVSKGTLILAH
jgi:hypothetical protein